MFHAYLRAKPPTNTQNESVAVFHIIIIFIAHMTYDFTNFHCLFYLSTIIFSLRLRFFAAAQNKCLVFTWNEMRERKRKHIFVNLKHKFHQEFTYVLLYPTNGYMGGDGE